MQPVLLLARFFLSTWFFCLPSCSFRRLALRRLLVSFPCWCLFKALTCTASLLFHRVRSFLPICLIVFFLTLFLLLCFPSILCICFHSSSRFCFALSVFIFGCFLLSCFQPISYHAENKKERCKKAS